MELLTSEFDFLTEQAGQMHAERRWLFISYGKQEHFIFLAGVTTVCFCGEEILFCVLENKGSFFAVACQVPELGTPTLLSLCPPQSLHLTVPLFSHLL